VTCLAVRERLGEHALGVLPEADRPVVDRHLEWCAACRKEAAELRRAAATLAYSVAPVEPPMGLEDRVVGAVRRAAGLRRASAPRRSRVAAAGVLAAMLALSGLGWGAVMAGRAERARVQVESARIEQAEAVANFQELIAELEGADPANIIELATLLSPRNRAGTGDALVLLSPSTDDLVFVMLRGLTEVREARLPLTVTLVSDEAGELVVGRIAALDAAGGGGVYRIFDLNLRSFDAIVVRDSEDRVLLNGGLGVYEPTA
jgi:hypothetical protein